MKNWIVFSATTLSPLSHYFAFDIAIRRHLLHFYGFEFTPNTIIQHNTSVALQCPFIAIFSAIKDIFRHVF